MKVIIRSSTFVKGELLEAGPKPIEVEDKYARQLIGSKKAVLAPAAKPKSDKGE